ncbi:cAMP-dependent protein kinase type II regulatory subunit isoform X2 [Lingula anatina]|uniref:cAMP-dependent protein kinase type II regulatory subunit n=1 Tax=Lingula anatina TaxID=7574 RepID=A0A2R2MQ37_LINAN|nr:cAMP-dependent protein kinase type II regulatory subunit isoform X2 [Lingula anatina]|eukprot:XP_023932346.1 cAMP-dependent protein kinase type II regulatory subunit isoform X2 [Lingula anatina]
MGSIFTKLTAWRRSEPITSPPSVGEAPATAEGKDQEPPMKNRYQRRKSVSAERYDPEADEDEGDQRVVHPKSDEQRKRLSEAVKNILIFRSLDIEQMQEVIDAMFEKKTQPNEHVIDQGDDGDNFYVIDSGTYDIYVDDNLVGAYENQGSFGELALMYNMPRAATIIATSAGSIWAMDRHTFRRIVLKNAFNKRKMYENLLETVPMLKTLEPYERMNVADALISKTYEDGTQIIKQGDTADCMYFVESGEVRITVKNDSNDEKEVNRIKTGGYLGELALLTHKPRAASAYAVGTTKCAVLDVQAFERLLGPCMDVMKRNIDEYEEQLAQVFGSKVEITDLR